MKYLGDGSLPYSGGSLICLGLSVQAGRPGSQP